MRPLFRRWIRLPGQGRRNDLVATDASRRIAMELCITMF